MAETHQPSPSAPAAAVPGTRKVSRKIAAILAADVVGYSRLMGADDEGTFAALKSCRAIFDRLVIEFDGQEFGCVGDSLMAQFPSPVNAVRCAQSLQHAVAAANEAIPADRRMTLRIGVNLGDVIDENGALFGDGVNVAARLQTLAEPGGILVSGAVYEQVKNKVSATFSDAGERSIKNIAEPVRTYVVAEPAVPHLKHRVVAFLKRRGIIAAAAYVVVAWLIVWVYGRLAVSQSTPGWLKPAVITLLSAGFIVAIAAIWRFDRRRPSAPWVRFTAVSIATVVSLFVVASAWRDYIADPAARGSSAADTAPVRSIAVLPFGDLSLAHNGAVLATGISEAVLYQLANLRELVVIARTSSFAFQGQNQDAREIGRKLNVRYLLEGNVQSDERRLRVTARLIDAITGTQVWSIRRDKTLQDIFALQDEIALEVTRALELSLDANAMAKLAGTGTTNFDAYLPFLEARALLASGRVTETETAIQQLNRAIEIDPKFAPAYVTLASAQVQLAEFEITDDRQTRFVTAVDEARALLEKALALDSSNGEAYVERGYLTAFTDLAGAEADYRRGLELSPNYARGYEGLAAVLYEDPARSGEALEVLDRARRLDPLEPRYDVAKAVFLLYGRSNITEASDLLVRALTQDPQYGPALARLAEVRWVQGEFAEAARWSEQALSLDPLSEWTRQILICTYLDMGDRVAAQQVLEESPHPLAVRGLAIEVYDRDWRRAGETAYASIENETLSSLAESMAAAAIRMHARTTGDYARARAALEEISDVTWDEEGSPTFENPINMKDDVIGLADMLQATGEKSRAQRLLEASLADMDYVSHQLERGDLWLLSTRARAQALLGDTNAAIETVQRLVASRANMTRWWYAIEGEPAYAGLRKDPRFKVLLETVHEHAARQRERLTALRAEGLVPNRSAPASARQASSGSH